MTAPDIKRIHQAGIRSTLELWLFLLAGTAGTAGITITSAIAVVNESRPAVRMAFNRLAKRGLIMPPSRDTSQGRTNRYTILPAGLALLQTPPASKLVEISMAPLPIAS